MVLDTSTSDGPILPDGQQPAMCVTVVLNRPTANVVQVHTDSYVMHYVMNDAMHDAMHYAMHYVVQVHTENYVITM